MSAKSLKSLPLDRLHPLVALALKGLKPSVAQRETVLPGDYEVDAVLHIKATLKVSDDKPAVQANKIEPWTIIALLLDRLPPTALDEVVAEASALLKLKDLEEDEDEGDRVVLVKERAQSVLDGLADPAADAVDAIKGETKQMRKGAVKKVSISVTAVDQETSSEDDDE